MHSVRDEVVNSVVGVINIVIVIALYKWVGVEAVLGIFAYQVGVLIGRSKDILDRQKQVTE
jgi:hypothetical protein